MANFAADGALNSETRPADAQPPRGDGEAAHASPTEVISGEVISGEVIAVGLGPGRWDDLTLEAQAVLMSATHITFRTLRHPTVQAFSERRPELSLESFDTLYDTAESFATLYPAMAARLITSARTLPSGTPLVYAVPGHPLLGEESVVRLRAESPAAGVAVRLVAGLSFVEPVCTALDVDPLDRDLQLLDATSLAQASLDALGGILLPTKPVLIGQVYNRRLASGVKLALAELYPDDWEVALVRWAGLAEQRVERIPLVELDRSDAADHLTTLYIPPLAPEQAVRVPEGLRWVVARLRAPNGCPWDREQTHQSLRKYVLEEAYEVAEVLDEWDASQGVSQAAADKLAEELGDLLLQVYLQAEIANEEDLFSINDVYGAITEKLIRRHPHVFGAVKVRDAEHVVRNWEMLKQKERAARGENVARESALRGVPKSAPSLYQAYELSKKAAKVGFDWPSMQGALSKVAEEAGELASAVEHGARDEAAAELGDLLFALATLARSLGLQPEDALYAANRRFRARFEAMEQRAQIEKRSLESLTPDEWLAWWDHTKASSTPQEAAP
ncbi:MAG TPA: nucleoside triphosphate pyrophosphohydrolase [Ktedonobacterales bacterium]